ncbi:MAG: S41 family peptidase [Bacilli bacterium]|nr:S41 family peptidase [Bacilli bacterium]
MKKRVLASVAFTFIAIPLLSNCNNNRLVTNPWVYEITDDGIVSYDERTSYNFFDGSSVPYKSVSRFVAEFLDFSTYEEDPGIASISVVTDANKHRSTFTNTTTGATAVMDYNKQTITYDDATEYFCDSSNPDIPAGCDMGGNQFFPPKGTSSERSSHSQHKIYLNDYNLRGYLLDGEGYLPEAVMMNALAPYPYLGIIYNGKGCYLTPGSGAKEGFYRAMKTIADEAVIFDDEFMEYNYNVLALMLDCQFGLAGGVRDCRNPNTYEEGSKQHHFFSKAYDVLAEYKKQICSKEPGVSAEALTDFKINFLDDGGHSFYRAANVFTSYAQSDAMRDREHRGISSKHPEGTDEYSHTLTTLTNLTEERAKTKYDPTKMTGDMTADAAFDIYANKTTSKHVAYITFDGFDPAESGGTVVPGDITKKNYYKNTISLIYWADQHIRNDQKVHDILINLSCNGGGAVYVGEFITSWLCGSSTLTLYNRHDQSTRTLTRTADVNLNGGIDDEDHLDSSKYNVYFIISNGSFSCGNLLPCLIKDYYPNPTNVHFMGAQTGGGCCAVSSVNCDALGNNFVLSSLYTLCRKNSSETVESGVLPDAGHEFTSPSQFFDIPTIIEEITAQ